MASSQSNNKKDLDKENEPKFNKFCKVIDLFTLVYNDITHNYSWDFSAHKSQGFTLQRF
jgi:hypothetical protein